MKIAVVSGKGGTGKTTIATGLAQIVSQQYRTCLMDCDVEGPNTELFFQADFLEERTVQMMLPRVRTDLCTSCGVCGDVCQYNAIVMLRGKPVVFPDLCHGCGSCSLNCPEGAIEEYPQRIGLLRRSRVNSHLTIQQGSLDIGKAQAVPVISQLKSWSWIPSPELTVLDGPPGASCPVVEAIRGSSYVVLVTEPTPFGFHDLKQALQISRQMGLPAGVIINRDGVGDEKVETYCKSEEVPILMRIPLKQQYAEGLALGRTLAEIDPRFRAEFNQLLIDIVNRLDEGILL